MARLLALTLCAAAGAHVFINNAQLSSALWRPAESPLHETTELLFSDRAASDHDEQLEGGDEVRARAAVAATVAAAATRVSPIYRRGTQSA